MINLKKKISYILLILVIATLSISCDTEELIEKPVDEDRSKVIDVIDSGVDLDQELEDIAEPVNLVRVIDGDTIVVKSAQGEETVRLMSVDTPESVHPDIEEKQPFSEDATKFTTQILGSADIEILLERGKPEKDKYDRTLGYIWIKGNNGFDDSLFNSLLVFEGFARLNVYDNQENKYLGELARAEDMAKSNKFGIWSIDGYVTDRGFNPDAIKK